MGLVELRDFTGKSPIQWDKTSIRSPPAACIDFPTGNAILGLRGLLKVTPSALCSPDLSFRLLDPRLFAPPCRYARSRRRKECQDGFCRSLRLAFGHRSKKGRYPRCCLARN